MFTPEYIGPNFELKEETRSTDQYDASQNILSGYGMVDLPLTTPLRLVAGVRVEGFYQQVNTYSPFANSVLDDNSEIIQANLNETNIFPAVNLVYSIRPNQNLRVGLSQTVNRPEFREVAPFEFTDVIGGRAMIGNPDLQQSLIQNFDIRWEMFPGEGEVASVGLFYKNFDSPIERIIEPTSQLRTSFTNAQSARNTGIEIEGQKALNRYMFLGANYTYVDSRVTLNPASRQVQTSLVRPLAGTSKNLFNTMFEVRNHAYSGRLLWNFYGDRISDVGSLGLPDIIQEGRNSLDFIFSMRPNEILGLKFAVTNLTNRIDSFTQGGENQRIFRLGPTVALVFTVKKP